MHVRAAVLTLTTLVACKSTVDTAGFEKTLEERVKAMGLTPGKVSCPKDVEAKVGAVFTCSIGVESATYDLQVTIRSVDKDKKDVQMDTAWAKGNAVIRQKVVDATTAQLGEQFGTKVAIDCGTEPLIFIPADNTTKCKLTAGATNSTLVLTYKGTDLDGWKLDPPVLAKKKVEDAIIESIRAQSKPTATVSCGTEPLFARPADGKLPCDANVDGEIRKIHVIVSPDLNVEKWEPVAAAPADGPPAAAGSAE